MISEIKILLLKIKSRLGNAEAMFCLAQYYIFGVCVKTDVNKAYILLNKAAEKGFDEARKYIDNNIKTDAEGNINIPILDDLDMVRYIRNLTYYSDKGDAIAQWMRGVPNLSEDSDEYQFQRGLYWVGLAAKQNFPPAQFSLAELYLSEKRVKGRRNEGMALLNKAAEAGDMDAIRMLFSFSPKKAAFLIKREADKGDGQALGILSQLYHNGFMVEQDDTKALEYLQKAVEQNDKIATFNMALGYEKGMLNLPMDIEKAIHYYKICIDKHNDPDAMNALGCIYESNPQFKDKKQALQLFQQAAEQDNGDGYCNLGRLYKEGMAVERNGEKAAELLVKATDLGCLEAYYNLVRLYADDEALPHDYNTADQWLQKGADAGEVNCIMILANQLRDGYNREQDLQTAFNHYQKAAETGIPDAFVNLGYMYRYGVGTEQNSHKAFQWFQKAADADNTEGIACLGQCYTYAIGTPKDDKKAVELYRIAAERGHAQAQLDLGICYRFGEGIEQDFKKARQWYQKAIDQDNAKAMLNMGVLYHNGMGVNKDFEKAFIYFSMAADRDDADAQCMLGHYYLQGLGTDKNETEAVKWYKKAAEQGEPDSQYHLAKCYYQGIGVEEDPETGYRYLIQSAKQGFGPAVEELENNTISPQNYHF